MTPFCPGLPRSDLGGELVAHGDDQAARWVPRGRLGYEWTWKELVAVATRFPCRQERIFFFLPHLPGLLSPPHII